MTEDIVSSGFNLAMEIVRQFRPEYWKKDKYGHYQNLIKCVKMNSQEFLDLEDDISTAQDFFGTDYRDEVQQIERIQNPYTFARFILRTKSLKMEYGEVYQVRRYKLINMKYLDMALKYNCDGRRFGKPNGDYMFYAGIPNLYKNYVLLVVQVLTTDPDNIDDDEDILCSRDSEFYIEYVAYFD